MKFAFIVMAICAAVCANAQSPALNFDPISVTTVAPPVDYLGPADASGNIFIGTNHSVKRINPNGTITVIAGTGVSGYVDGPGTSAQFSTINGLVLDAAGNIYVGDTYNYAIRKITPAGVVSTLAGNGTAGYVDDIGAAARFNGPKGIVIDAAGNLFAADGSTIRKITPAAVVSTFASRASSSNALNDPADMAIDLQGNLYVQQVYGSLLKFTSAGVVSYLEPVEYTGFKQGVAVDKLGNIYVPVYGVSGISTDIIYKIFPSVVAAPIAGSFWGYKDSTGAEAQFLNATHLSLDPADNNIYVSDVNGVRKISKPVLSFTANAGSPSPAKYFNVSGNYLSGAANLQAPAGYEMALIEAGPYSSTLTAPLVTNEVHARRIYIRLAAGIAEGTYNDSVVFSSNGAVTKKLGVTGLVQHMPRKLVIIGSGTSACIGLDPSTACYVGKVNSYYNKQAPFDTTIDNHLARGSTNCYNGMPSSYISPYGAGSIYAPIKDINITAALALNPDVILVNYPTQNYDVLSVNEIMFCLRTIRDSANKKGVPCYITTTQPRTNPASFNTPVIKLKLAALKDSILAVFGNFAIDFWTGLINPADSSVLYDQGDQINMNPTGHTILAQRVITRNVFGGTVTPVGTGAGVKAEYYNSTNFTSPAVTRTDAVINNDFNGVSPDPGIVNTDNYSVLWTGEVQPLYSETYTFYTNTDNGVRLWVNGVQLIDSWIDQPVSEKSGTIALAGGQKYDIKMEYYHLTGHAVSKLSWSSATTVKTIIPTTQLYLPVPVAPPIPACANNITPANGTTIASSSTAILTWDAVSGASSYNVYIWRGATPPTAPTAFASTNTYTAPGLTGSTLYNWYVVPRNSLFSAADCGVTNKTSFTTAGATPGTGLQGVYYNGTTLSGTPLLTRIDPTINFDLSWHSPAPGTVPQDNYSVRWTGQVMAVYSEIYTFHTISDDGIRLWVNGVKLVDDWMNQGATEYSGGISLVAGQKYDIVIEYYEAAGDAVTKLSWTSPSTPTQIIPQSQLYPPATVTAGTGLQGVYYSGNALSGAPLLTRIDPLINFDLSWMSPAPGTVPQDNYSVRWTGQVKAAYSETYTFYTTSDDGIRLWVNGVQLVNDWMNQGATEYSGSITLVAGQRYDIVIEYYEAAGDAVTKLAWSSASTPKAIIPQSQLYPPGAALRVMDPSTLTTAAPEENSSLPSVTAVISPNPVSTGQQAKLQINSNKAGTVMINTISSNGAIIGVKKVQLVTGINNTTINTHGLAQGFHVIKIVGSDKPLNLKLIVE